MLAPSTVDLLINGVQQPTARCCRGSSIFQTAPSITGGHITAADYRSQRPAAGGQYLFGTSPFLQRSLSDWEVNLGVNKLNYAVVLSATGMSC